MEVRKMHEKLSIQAQLNATPERRGHLCNSSAFL